MKDMRNDFHPCFILHRKCLLYLRRDTKVKRIMEEFLNRARGLGSHATHTPPPPPLHTHTQTHTHSHTFFAQHKQKREVKEKRKSFKAETIERLSPGSKCYYFSHTRGLPYIPCQNSKVFLFGQQYIVRMYIVCKGFPSPLF